ncbi:hypothetical protein [Parafrankia sp. BMG5.11]|uniref:hypothetical protein n=1 Tax=Parafrankia sp. BMG5.11 TaxID=222540 RepID=UPI001FB51E76|nr:hypothetical protein [Parafrankia sp. BMG5.11]
MADEISPAGRHRSPWGRSKRILPIRWGRVAAAVGAAAALATTLFLIHNSGSGPASAVRDPAGARTSIVVSTSVASPPVPSPTANGPVPVGAFGASGPPEPVESSGVSASPEPSQAGGTSAPARPGAGTGGPRGTPPAGPAIGLSRTDVDFGEVESTIRLDVLGVGTSPARVRVGDTPGWVSVVPGQDVVGPGAQVPLVVTLDRAVAPPGSIDLDVPVSAVDGSGGGNLRITARVSGAPGLSGVSAAPTTILPSGCAGDQGTTQATVTATVVDPTGVLGVEVRTRAPDGQATTTPLQLGTAVDDRSTWSGPIGPVPAAGTITYTVVATDLDGRSSTTDGSVEVRPCPAG